MNVRAVTALVVADHNQKRALYVDRLSSVGCDVRTAESPGAERI